MKSITIDIGTTTIKCALFDNGKIIKYFSKEYELLVSGNRVEQSADTWRNIIAEGIRSFGISEEIKGVCISSQGITILPVDVDGKPMSNALSWLDNTTTKELDELRAIYNDEYIFNITGKNILPCYSIFKIKNMVDNGINANKYLMPSDYIYYLLTGKYYTDYTMASGTMLFDIKKCRYDNDLLKFCGINEEQLAVPVEMGTRIGEVTEFGCMTFGIPVGTPVIMGAQDQKISAYACDLKKGTATVSIGTSTAVSVLEDGGREMSVFAYNKDSLIYESAISTTGAAIKWLKNLAFDSYEEMDKCAESAMDDGGCIFNSDFTEGASVLGLSLAANKGNIVIALYNDIAKRINNVLPKGLNEIILFGGGAKSKRLCEVIKNTTKCRITVPDSVEIALIGADMLINKNCI